jgi:hypothetical protein
MKPDANDQSYFGLASDQGTHDGRVGARRGNQNRRRVAELDGAKTATDGLVSVLTLLARHVLAAERRLGPVVFRDMLGLHFSSTRPIGDELGEYPLAEFVVAAIADAQGAGQVSPEADAGELGVFFLTGLFALLATGTGDSAGEDAMLRRYVTTIVQGMETR